MRALNVGGRGTGALNALRCFDDFGWMIII